MEYNNLIAIIKLSTIVLFVLTINSCCCQLKASSSSEKNSGESSFVNFREGLGPRIIGGKFADPGEFPYYVQVITQLGDYFPTCGGTMINPSTVITAAHCVWDNGEPAKMVVVQSKAKNRPPLLLSSKNLFEWQLNNGTKLIVHENYTISEEGIPINDIALIQLESSSSSSISGKQGIVKLASKHYPIGTPVVLAGYGLTENGISPHFLKKKDSILVSSSQEKGRSGSLDGVLFTHRTDDDLAYIGDSGGPVIVKGSTPDQDELVGIISFGDELLEGNREGSTDVYHYLDWIKSKV